jgi:hypothetical protein
VGPGRAKVLSTQKKQPKEQPKSQKNQNESFCVFGISLAVSSALKDSSRANAYRARCNARS